MKKDSEDKRPVGVVVVTHTDYGAALLRAAECILGPASHAATISVDVSLPVEQTIDQLRQALKDVDQGAGALIMTDMFGGTPTNLSLSLLGERQVEVITGVNLPMLIKGLSARTLPLAQLAEDAKAAGLSGIVVAGQMLKSRTDKKAAGGERA